MNIKRVYKKVLLEESLRESLLLKIKKFVDDNRAIFTREITKAQWNGLLSFCMRKENIDNMIHYIQEKMERKESSWTKRVKEEEKDSTIGEYIIKHLREIKGSRLADLLEENKHRINEVFPEENLESILTDEEKEEIVLLQARLFIRTVVKNVLIKFEEGL